MSVRGLSGNTSAGTRCETLSAPAGAGQMARSGGSLWLNCSPLIAYWVVLVLRGSTFFFPVTTRKALADSLNGDKTTVTDRAKRKTGARHG